MKQSLRQTTRNHQYFEERLLNTFSSHSDNTDQQRLRGKTAWHSERSRECGRGIHLKGPVHQQCRVEEIPRRLKLTTECLVFSGKSPHTWSVTLRRNSLGAWLILSIQLRTCQTAWGEVPKFWPMFKRLWCSQHLMRPLMAKLTGSTRQRHHVMPDASHYLWSFQRTMAS